MRAGHPFPFCLELSGVYLLPPPPSCFKAFQPCPNGEPLARPAHDRLICAMWNRSLFLPLFFNLRDCWLRLSRGLLPHPCLLVCLDFFQVHSPPPDFGAPSLKTLSSPPKNPVRCTRSCLPFLAPPRLFGVARPSLPSAPLLYMSLNLASALLWVTS